MAKLRPNGPGRIYGTPTSVGEARAIIMLAAASRELGRPPSWSEYGSLMGWPRDEVDARVRELHRVGVRWLSGRELSLNVTPEALRRSLDIAREARQHQESSAA